MGVAVNRGPEGFSGGTGTPSDPSVYGFWSLCKPLWLLLGSMSDRQGQDQVITAAIVRAFLIIAGLVGFVIAAVIQATSESAELTDPAAIVVGIISFGALVVAGRV